jgi:hypothetical protein
LRVYASCLTARHDAGILDNVGCVGIVGFIPALKHGGFSSIFRNNPNNITTLRKQYKDDGTESLLSGTHAVGGYETDTYTVTLDGSDSTTWIEVTSVNRRSLTVHAVSDNKAAGVWAFGVPGDFDSASDADGLLHKSSPAFEFRARIASSTLQVSADSTGHEGETVKVAVDSLT